MPMINVLIDFGLGLNNYFFEVSSVIRC
jgi:hypothetical protein